MDIEYGAQVIDREGKALGTVDHVVRNTWTGEISKFMVRRKAPDKDLFFSVNDVLKATTLTVKVKVSFGELNTNA